MDTEDGFDFSPQALAAANLSPATGLATDYLNVFNEGMMLIGLVADMPDMYDELKAWVPLSYREHFEQSGFKSKALAIAAYDRAASVVRKPFDEAASALSANMAEAISLIGDLLDDPGALGETCSFYTAQFEGDIARLDAMIHGQAGSHETAQDAIDALFD